MAFTEQGIAMLPSVLNSDRAIQVNIQIMIAFTRLRQMISTNQSLQEIKRKIKAMENKYDDQFKKVFKAIEWLINKKIKPKNEIGIDVGKKK